MPTQVQAGVQSPELSCRESELLLRVIPPLKIYSSMSEEETSAIDHYVCCKSCRSRGLTEILAKPISCMEAVMVWAENPGALWMYGESIREIEAVEHIWGKYQCKNKYGGCGYDDSTACKQRHCLEIRVYWMGVPMSTSAGDGPGGVIHELPLIIKIFLREGWPLKRLLATQKERMERVLRDIESGKITVSSGHYHSTDELVQEVKANLQVLQDLVMEKIK